MLRLGLEAIYADITYENQLSPQYAFIEKLKAFDFIEYLPCMLFIYLVLGLSIIFREMKFFGVLFYIISNRARITTFLWFSVNSDHCNVIKLRSMIDMIEKMKFDFLYTFGSR